jgi:geranylgeranyl pyrophosphate synthase
MSDPAPALSQLDLLKSAVDERIVEVVSSVEPASLRDALANTLEGGKRIRPLCALLACAAAGGSELDALNGGVAIELLHGASLVHDDIMDGSEVRRGKPSLHVLHGVPAAILAGDLMIATAFRVLHGDERARKVRVVQEFTEAFVQLCEGQSHDIAFSDSDPIDLSGHREMVRKKTAQLLARALKIGALMATDDDRTIESLYRFGLHLGLAYQAKDDILDECGTEQRTGKPRGLDRKNGRTTYLTMAYPETDTESVVRSVVEDETGLALHALGQVPPTPARAMLAHLARMLVERQY